jgi:transcriptional repressor NrdR
MVCIYCGSQTQVSNSRHKRRTNEVWRRRTCQNCQAVFTTLETPTLEQSVSVIGKSGRLEPFERDKLYLSIVSACGHRKHPSKDATGLTATVISQLLPQIKQASLSKSQIIEVTSKVLGRFDKSASSAYQAYHPK